MLDRSSRTSFEVDILRLIRRLLFPRHLRR